jgi:hypothetical protein
MPFELVWDFLKDGAISFFVVHIISRYVLRRANEQWQEAPIMRLR